MRAGFNGHTVRSAHANLCVLTPTHAEGVRMTLTIPTYEEIIAAWHALEDETESSATLMQRVCHILAT